MQSVLALINGRLLVVPSDCTLRGKCGILTAGKRGKQLGSQKRGSYDSPRQSDRRRRILHAASTHLEQFGLEALSMGSIAEVSGVSVKTLYNLYGSRDQLLLAAASDVLADLGQRDSVLKEAQGLPRLRAYVVSSMADFKSMPQYAYGVISILVKADLGPEVADLHMGVVRRFALSALQYAQTQGELREGTDLAMLAQHISANQWGAVLLWQKGLIPVEALAHHVDLSHFLTLLPFCVGARREKMEAELSELMAKAQPSALTTLIPQGKPPV